MTPEDATFELWDLELRRKRMRESTLLFHQQHRHYLPGAHPNPAEPESEPDCQSERLARTRQILEIGDRMEFLLGVIEESDPTGTERQASLA